jgi:hypothetical protein
LRTEVGALNLIELTNLAPSFVAHRSRNVNFQFQDRHVFGFVALAPGRNLVLGGAALHAAMMVSTQLGFTDC